MSGKLQITTFGGLSIQLEDQPLTGFASRKVEALLVYLACTGRPQRREVLAELLWEERSQERSMGNLRVALTSLRKELDDFVLIERDTVAINPDAQVWLDAAELEAGLAGGKLEQAVALYQGPFLEGYSLREARGFEDWASAERGRLEQLVLDALASLADRNLQRGAFRSGLEHANRLLSLNPLNEGAHRAKMLLLACSGGRSAALAQFESCRQVLIEELGVEPSPELQETYDLLLKGERPPGIPEVPGAAQRRLEVIGECPYRGLAAFREADAPFFFGRGAFSARLYAAVTSQPLTAVIVGSSGSGKSSAVYAGLLPRLRQEGDWLIADFRPGAEPFQALASTLVPLAMPNIQGTEQLVENEKLAKALQAEQLALYSVVEQALKVNPENRRLLLIADQFEELYTLCPEPETRRRYLDLLLEAVQTANGLPGPRFVLLLTLRADFMGQALAHRPFADALQEASLIMGPMNREELRAAIEKPAELQGAAFEAGLVERLLDDVGQEPGNLPLLEFALTLLWERISYGWMTHAGYEEIGRVEGALARYADQVYEGLDAGEQEQARRIFIQLVRPGEGTEDTRRRASRGEVGEGNWSLVQRLADKRLVVTGRDAGENETVEVVHEALIQGWGKLGEWIDEDRAFRTWQERLRANLRQWRESGEDEGALLRGGPLVEAEGWLARRGEELSQDEVAYIQAGIALRERMGMERERRRRTTIAALAVGLVLALVLAAVALYQRQNSLRQAAILLAGQAETALANGYHDQAILLALAALEDYPYTPQAEHALGQAVSYNRALQIYSGHTSAVTSAAWSPDGERLATSSSSENRVDIWDPNTGKLIQAIHMPTGITGNKIDMALNVQWTPGGTHLLTVNGDRYTLGSQDYDLLMWEAASGELLSSLEIGNQAEPESGELGVTVVNYPTGAAAEIAPLSGRLATLGGDNTAIIWDESWQKPDLVLKGHAKGVSSVDWSPDEEKLATASLDGTVMVWDARTGQALYTLAGDEGRINLALWSPDGSQIVTGGADGVVRLWDAANGELKSSILTNAGEIFSLVWAPNGVRIFSGHRDGSLRIWEVASGKLLETLRGHQGIITDLKWSPADDHLASVDGSGYARVWNAAPSTAWRLYPPQAERGGDWSVCGASWSSDGRYLAMAGGDPIGSTEPPSFAIWDVEANQLIMENLGDELNFIGNEANFSPDDRAILYQGSGVFPDLAGGESAYVFDAGTGQVIYTFTPDGVTQVRSSAWSLDGFQVATGLFNGDILIWDYQTGKQVARLVDSTDRFMINYVEWSPDGSKIAAASDDSNAYIWDAFTWEPLFTLHHEPPTFVGTAAWSPDGTRLLTTAGNDEQGAKDHTARIWDAATGKELLAFHGHTQFVCPGDWSPDGKRVATFGNDGFVKIWDSSTGDELLTINVPVLYSGSAWWSRDGQHLAIVGMETLVSVWRVWQSKEELLAYAKECCVVRELSPEERELYGLPPR
ncbi:MAG: hypothetical protein JXA78_00170 [Anaerolineales bacterium]|nr:hypothetical protein [Anaerolineales bacterium]